MVRRLYRLAVAVYSSEMYKNQYIGNTSSSGGDTLPPLMPVSTYPGY